MNKFQITQSASLIVARLQKCFKSFKIFRIQVLIGQRFRIENIYIFKRTSGLHFRDKHTMNSTSLGLKCYFLRIVFYVTPLSIINRIRTTAKQSSLNTECAPMHSDVVSTDLCTGDLQEILQIL